jgi:hypothetical protein
VNACRDFRSRLASLLSGRASSASFGELAWHEHLLGCADCRALVETEQALEELLASLPQPQLPPELAQRLLARLEPARGDVALDLLLERGDAVAVPGALASRMLAKLDSARAAQREEARLDALLARLPEPQVPADLSRRTLARLALARRPHPAAPRTATPRRLALAAAALVTLALGAWLLGRDPRRDGASDIDLAQGPAPRVPQVAPRERVLDEPPADLLASLDLLESWELVVDDSVEADVLALDGFDALLLDVADELDAEAPAQPATEGRNG